MSNPYEDAKYATDEQIATAEVATFEPSNISATVNNVTLEVHSDAGPALIWDTVKLLIDGKPAPAFTRLVIEGEVYKPWKVKIEFMPK